MHWLPYSSHTSHYPSQTPCFPRISYATQKWCSIHARWSKSSLKYSIRFCGIFPSLKQNCIAYHSSKVSTRPDLIFEIHQLWQSGFSRVYSNFCCSCSFEPEIIKIGQPSYKMYATILNACTKKSGNLLNAPPMSIHRDNEKCIEREWRRITVRDRKRQKYHFDSPILLSSFFAALIYRKYNRTRSQINEYRVFSQPYIMSVWCVWVCVFVWLCAHVCIFLSTRVHIYIYIYIYYTWDKRESGIV